MKLPELTKYERDMVAGIIQDLGGATEQKCKRKNPINYRTKGVVNYPLYMLLHGAWDQLGGIDYGMVSEDHHIMQYLKIVLNDDQYAEVLFHKRMTPIEFRATRKITWSNKNESYQSL